MIKQYSKYKDSEVHWLGKVPEHWKVKRVKDVAKKMGSGVTPKGGSESYKTTGITFLRSQNVYDNGLKLDNVSYIDSETHQKMQNSQIKPLDILINITGASIGRSCIVPDSLEEANINQHILYLRASKELVPFISLYIKSNLIKDYINLIQSGSSREGLSMGETRQFSIPLPPIQEQKQIADYLEKKTTAIDKKIDLLEQKIEHYQNLRKSLINETVTKGLDKNVKLKDSGIEWIGQIPEHWEVKRIKDLFKTLSGGTPSTKNSSFWTGAIPWIPSGAIQNNNVNKEIVKHYISEEALNRSSTKLASKGSVLIALTGATCSNVGFLNFDTTINQSIVSMTSSEKNIYNRYYYYYLMSKRESIRALMTGGAQEGINQGNVRHLKVCFFSREEQQQIADYLDTKTQTIDTIIDTIKDQIITLKELRKTLINDVVTGKIKVTA
ncbi:MAG: restriction endonuclease subunit S [Flavobacteriaceae bacterium]|nr:restriction endonuclease subunit S [Flavobacteriaceae bacterium]